jgi:hypothetical protein
MSQSRNWCFTINNPKKEDLAVLSPEVNPDIRYIVLGMEKGKLEETPHVQGFVVFHKHKRFAAVKKIMDRAHIEPARGTWKQAADYCKKDGVYTEYGIPPMSQSEKGEVERRRWKRVLDQAIAGEFDDIQQEEPQIYLMHKRKLYEHTVRSFPTLENPVMYWYSGPTGSGKSRKAREEHPDAYMKMCNKWWDTYNFEEVVIIEDFDMSHSVLGHHMKIWADRYSFRAEVKNGSIMIRPKTIIVTSNYTIDQIWSDPNMYEPLQRRFTEITIN